jgi:crotonobetainyl-CoA:carnitine CoA-transferase CaiB-like acyl-CoA transferase
MVPWQAFATQDGYIVVATREDIFWRNLCEVIGEPLLGSDPRFATNAMRVKNKAELVPKLEGIFRAQRTHAWMEVLRGAQVPAAPVNHIDQAFAEPPVAEREMIVEYDHPQVGKVRMPGNPIKMSGVNSTHSRPAPLLGEHTDAVLKDLLGLQPERIESLRHGGAIG